MRFDMKNPIKIAAVWPLFSAIFFPRRRSHSFGAINFNKNFSRKARAFSICSVLKVALL